MTGLGNVLGFIKTLDCKLRLLLRMQTPWILYGAGGPTNPPDWLAMPSQLVDFAIMRELCLGMTATNSLPFARHQAPRRHTPSNNSAWAIKEKTIM